MIAEQRIICGDVIDVIKSLPRNKIALIFADPPYNIGIDYGAGVKADRLRSREFREWCLNWISQAGDILRSGGAFWLLINEANADYIGDVLTHHVGPRRSRLIWHETFSQYQDRVFTNEHRHLFYHLRKCPGGRDAHTWHADPIRVPSARQLKYNDKRANPKGRVPGDVWRIPRVCGSFKERVGWHPAQLPEQMLERIMLCCTDAGDLVVDLFAGSGSLAMVCQRTARNFIGIDNNPDYVKRATERLEHAG